MNDLKSPPEVGVVGVIKGIVEDFQRLVQQQLGMVRAEVKSDWDKTKQAAWPFAVGIGLALTGGMLLCFMLVYLLHWLTAPAGTDPATIPLWGCYALVGAPFALLGVALMYQGVNRFRTFNPLPDESARALEENVQWLTRSR